MGEACAERAIVNHETHKIHEKRNNYGENSPFPLVGNTVELSTLPVPLPWWEGNIVDLRKREACSVPLSGETGRLAFRTQGGAALTLGYNIQPFQGKNPPPKGVHIVAQGKHPGHERPPDLIP